MKRHPNKLACVSVHRHHLPHLYPYVVKHSIHGSNPSPWPQDKVDKRLLHDSRPVKWDLASEGIQSGEEDRIQMHAGATYQMVQYYLVCNDTFLSCSLLEVAS